MFELRLSPRQTAALDRAIRKIEAQTGKKLSRGAAIAYFADYVVAHKEELRSYFATNGQTGRD